MKSLFEQFGGTYHNESDYLIPNLTLPKSEENDIGIYGQQHLRYLQEYLKLTYINLLTNGVLNEYLSEIDNQACERFSRIVEQMKQEQEITEQLKEDNPIEWTRKMNCIRQQVEEIVLNEVTYN
ncbi:MULTISPECIES: TnpV protein [Clostridia]|uniref:TnpV protein n=1 Tax=Clostridia TaxID=186801 RepID=UPI001413145D|nr:MULTISPECIES: TnpV protein [Eubacteriales]NBJ88544.1 TnpV protein [Acutalibacter sp. 1XD8-36]